MRDYRSEYSELARLAEAVARAGGKILLDFHGKVTEAEIEEKHQGDWVSAADRASEQRILDLLSREVPDHDILTEETGFHQRHPDAPYRWIIDPLDGTTNYLRGLPIWAVSVAVERRRPIPERWGDIVAGAIAIPALGEMFTAFTGGGAFRDGRRINVGRGRPLSSCLLATGFPFRTRHLADTYMALFQDLLLRSADVRRPGAVAFDLCYLACGAFDGFWELDLGPWDLAAGALIIREAGGVVSNFQGGEDFLSTGDIIAANPAIWQQMTDIVSSYFQNARQVDKFPLKGV